MSEWEGVALSDSPTLLYRCDEPSGTVVDQTGNGHTGTITGTSTYRYANVLPGRPGLRLQQSAYVAFSSGLNWGAGQALSIELWVALNSFPAGAACFLIGKASAPDAAHGIYSSNPPGEIVAFGANPVDEYGQMAESNGGAYKSIGTGPHHVVATYTSGNVLRLYLDGVQQWIRYSIAPTYTVSWSLAPTMSSRPNSGSERVGQQAGGSYDSGDVTYGGVALYGSALTADAVRAHYLAGIRRGVAVG